MPLVSFSPGQVIKSADVNSNFGLCVLTDTSRTVSVTHTWSATQTFSGGFTTASNASITGTFLVSGLITAQAGVTVTGSVTLATAVSKIVPGATSLSLRNNADAADNLLIDDAGDVTVRTTLTAPVFLVSSVQNVSGIFRVTGSGTGYAFARMTNTTADLAWGIENSAGAGLMSGSTAYSGLMGTLSATPMHLCTSGAVRVTVTAAGALTFAVAVSKVVAGATSLSLRNNADTQDNLLITDAGAVSVRGGLTVQSTLTVNVGAINNTGIGRGFQSAGTQVVGDRQTGYTNPWAGTLNRATVYDAASVTLVQLAQRVAAIQADITTHGLIGV